MIQKHTSGRIWKCDICGKGGYWTEEWSWYGSYAHMETCLQDIPTACSAACAQVMKQKIESEEWKLPVLRSRGYYMVVVKKRRGY